MGLSQTDADDLKAEIARRVGEARLRLVTSSSLQAAPLNLAMSLLLVAIIWTGADSSTLLYWLGAVAIVSLFRLAALFRAHRKGVVPGRIQMWLYLMATCMAGTLWGITPFLLPPEPPIFALMAVALFIPGMTAGAAMTSAADLRVVAAYNGPALGIFTLWCLSLPNPAPMMAIASTAFFIILLRLAKTYSRHIVEAVKANVHLEAARRETDAQTAALGRLAERQEQAARGAEGQARATAAMLSNMSHDIAHPLNTVLGMADMLKGASLPPDAARMVSRICEAGGDLSALVGGMLDVSRIHAGELELVLDDVSAMNLAERLESRFTPIAAAKGLEFEVDLKGELNLVLRADMARLIQIAEVYISNAIRFTEKGAISATIETTTRDVEGKEGMARLRLSVCDTGIGVPESAREHLFDSFSIHNADSAIREAGTGMGLHLAKLLAELMEGEAGYDPLDDGSRFYIEAPFRISCKQDKYADERLNMSARRLRVLVAEGDGTRRSVLLGYLKSFNCVVSCVPSRADMLAALNASAYDALVLGVTLSDLDPDDAAADVRALASTASMTPIVRLSADLDAPTARAGAEVYVRAPVAADPLLEGLRAALEHDPAAAAQLKRTAA